MPHKASVPGTSKGKKMQKMLKALRGKNNPCLRSRSPVASTSRSRSPVPSTSRGMSPVASTSWARSPSPSDPSSPSRSPEAASGSDSSSHDSPPVSSGSRQSQDLDLWLRPEGSPRSACSVADEGDAAADDAHGLNLASTRERVKEFYRTNRNVARDTDGISDIIVSFDSAWETRGHQSHIGLAFTVEAKTGAILDKQVLCNLCSVCERKRQSLPANDYANWLLSHTHCSKNFNGPAGRMEAEAAQRMFLHSTDFGLRYAYFIGDGDSSAYRSVRFIYGRDREVVKYECVNHIEKRMGTWLRKLKGTLTTPVTTRTGRVMCCSLLTRTLSNKNIDLLSRFYTLALKRSVNTSLETMRKNAIAPFYHHSSNDFRVQHQYCPDGADSWCFHNAAFSFPGESLSQEGTASSFSGDPCGIRGPDKR
ncbi:hypothetical protein C7M84_017791 [Penaeus vannamei]|uniref:Mutator-like transposase domain-containing protein n=1 Tax=Penaeus vannamei TaxID=6689 RepID=A0A3R7MKQ5_PENVA|nr:hypothetical protein C7M84_017791 [Penaeus vannamei]